ncbi:hypothetical protein GQ53DRAFT_845458 [Thozetella sp. PMI_491]|nr:hypothetical protein GQ53DRAFT_845458 [Thozetella sp. PMI_491]
MMDNYPYPYRALDELSIRLIRVLNTEPGSDEIQCELVHRSIDTSPPPEYIAVSYTWGDPADNRKIDVDGFTVSVPAALWEILSQIPSWVAAEPMLAARFPNANREQLKVFPVEYPWLLWADAVCINQQDAEEKSREIPRMTQIFRSAKEVVGWLGSNPLPGVDPMMLYHVFSRSRDLGKKGRANPEAWMNLSMATPDTLRTIMGVDDMHAFTDTLFAIASLPWFQRLWIIQEHAVARRSVALAIGPHVFDAQDLLMLLGLFAHRPEWFLQEVDLACALVMERIREQAEPWLADNTIAPPEESDTLDAFAQRLQALLAKASLAPFRATVKHDMIYGIISMAGPPDPLPEELAINYSLPWEEVCRR